MQSKEHRAASGRRYSRAVVVGLSMLLTLLVPAVWLHAQGQPPKGGAPPVPKKPGDSPPPAVGGKPAAPPPIPPKQNPAGGAPAAPAKPAPMPQGPIEDDDDPRVKAAVARAAAFLRHPSNFPTSQGYIALLVHALAKIHERYPEIVTAEDPVLQRGITELRKHTEGGYKPDSQGGHDNYESGVMAMALAAADGQAFKTDIRNVAEYILGKQRENGAWGYDGRSTGDTSQTQYSILGMWEAASGAGINIPKTAWDKVAQWLIRTQMPDGSFEYNPSEPQPGQPRTGHGTHTMTVASLGSLFICRDHLPGGKRKTSRGVLLQVQDEEELKADPNFKANTTPDQIGGAIAKATDWITKNYTLDKATGEGDNGGGAWQYYYIYAFERFGTLSRQKMIANHDWYNEGAQLLIRKQNQAGTWDGGVNNVADAAFSVLFLIRSTHISERIHNRRLGRGTLIGGRNLSKNLADLEQGPGGLRPKAVAGKIGDLLGKVEAGNANEIEAVALTALTKVYEKKWSAGGEEGDKLRKYYQRGVATQNSELIKFAMKALALSGDYKVVPILIDGMYYEEDAEVQLAAHQALCLISRKFNGFGAIYPEEATLEEWKAEIDRWKQWYRAVRPEYVFEDDVDVDVDKKTELTKSDPDAKKAKPKSKALTIPGVLTIEPPGPGFEWKPPQSGELAGKKANVYRCENPAAKGLQLIITFSPEIPASRDDAERAAQLSAFYNTTLTGYKDAGFRRIQTAQPPMDPPIPDKVTFKISGVGDEGRVIHTTCVCVFSKFVYFVQAIGPSPDEADALARTIDSLTEF